MNNPKELSKRQARREQMRRKEQRGRLVGIALITLGALAVAFLIIWPNFKPITGIVTLEPNPRPQADSLQRVAGPALGRPDLPRQLPLVW